MLGVYSPGMGERDTMRRVLSAVFGRKVVYEARAIGRLWEKRKNNEARAIGRLWENEGESCWVYTSLPWWDILHHGYTPLLPPFVGSPAS